MAVTRTPAYASVPREWAGETCVCIAGGPSLTQADVDACRGRSRVIAVNDAYRMAPWAEVLYACDYAWWRVHDGVKSFGGAKYSLDVRSARFPGVQVLRNTGVDGIESDRTALRTGQNGGYQALNLGLHYGVKRIVLLGYDMQVSGGKSHWFGDHPEGLQRRPPVGMFIPHFNKLAELLKAQRVDVVNCSRSTALKCFERQPIDQALSLVAA